MPRAVVTSHSLRRLALAGVTLSLFGLAGCHNDMWIQPKMKPQFQSDFFPDQQANRPLVAHSVARSQYWTDSERYTGYSDDQKIATTFPFKITVDDIKRGQNRFNIYCAPCHGQLGNGQGMIAQRGFSLRRPVGNYHTEKLLKAPVGHFYDVITNGFGTMYSYASRIEPDDRWRIVAYIKALQRSQAAKPEDVDRSKVSPDVLKLIDLTTPAPTVPPVPAPGTEEVPPQLPNGNVPPPPGTQGSTTPATPPVNESTAPRTGSSTRTDNAAQQGTNGAATTAPNKPIPTKPVPTRPETAPEPTPKANETAPSTTPSAGGANGTKQ